MRKRELFGLLALLIVTPLSAQAPPTAKAPLRTRIDQSAERGIEFLLIRGQNENGSFSPESGVAVTALCVRAILEHRPQAAQSPAVKQALQYIESMIRPDGGIYAAGSQYRNYETSVAVGAGQSQ